MEKVIQQTQEVLLNKKPKERIVSIYEPEARPFQKGKLNKKCEFGYEVQIQENEKLITGREINNKNSDAIYFPKSMEKHKELHNKPPNQVAADRGYYSQVNKKYAYSSGVKDVAIPKKGKLNQEEKERQSVKKFKKLHKWRSGVESTISLLKRCYGLTRNLYKGRKGMGLWVGAGILANNLKRMTKLIKA